MPVFRRALLLLVLLLTLAPVLPAATQTLSLPPGSEEYDTRKLVRADLIAEPAAIVSGEAFWVGIRLRMKQHWHTYWRNPGDSGLPTEAVWKLPDGFQAGPIVWPAPQRLPIAHLVNFGYENETILLTQVTPPPTLPEGGTLPIAAEVSFLVCETICIPGEASVAIDLPVAGPGQTVAPDPAMQAAFEAARMALPQPSPWPSKLTLAADAVTLELAAAGLRADSIRSAFFFPHAETLVDHAAPQTLTVDGGHFSLQMKPSSYGDGTVPDSGGVLQIEEDVGGATVRHAFAIATAEVGGTVAAAAQSPRLPEALPGTSASSLTAILQAMLFAFLGGIILNLMPCVFPVLSIKVLALVAHSGESRERVRLHGLSYTAGVLAMFVALAGILLAVRSAGAQVGWGYQLQSPVVIALLAFLLFAMGLNLSGVYRFGGSLAGIGGSLAQRGGLQGSFFTGMLATIVATPCTAPFMGAAIGFALTQPTMVSLAVFASLGLGLAAPFLLLTLVPQLAGRLPRPGAWMETLRQMLAFPLYATVVWLVWVVSQQVGPDGLLAVLSGMVLVALAGWALGQAQTVAQKTGTRRLAHGAAMLSLVAVAAIAVLLAQSERHTDITVAGTTAGGKAAAETYTPARLEALLAQGRPVFVNMTAAWCITCLVNERAALSSDSVQAAFADGGIVYMKGDWTNRDPAITAMLERHGRSGVPLYLFYAGGAGRPVVLPQILTPAIVLDHLGRATAAASLSPERNVFVSTSAGSNRP